MFIGVGCLSDNVMKTTAVLLHSDLQNLFKLRWMEQL